LQSTAVGQNAGSAREPRKVYKFEKGGVKATGSEAAILMNDLAADYDKLADRAALKANGRKSPPNGKPK
jgi:hypothetical protein